MCAADLRRDIAIRVGQAWQAFSFPAITRDVGYQAEVARVSCALQTVQRSW